jgi:putative hydrolase of the HAD superfamily
MPKSSPTIRALLFDLGGVLYDIDVQRSVDAFEKLGLPHFQRLYTLQGQSPLFDFLEKGRLNEDEFCSELNRVCGIELEPQQIIDCWNALLIRMEADTLQYLRELSQAYPVYLLSNTNAIHLAEINRHMLEVHGVPNLESLFDKAYFSFRLGMRKPDLEIYDYVLQDLGLKGEEVLFIEDSLANIAGAEKAGLRCVFKPKEKSLREVVEAGLGMRD